MEDDRRQIAVPYATLRVVSPARTGEQCLIPLFAKPRDPFSEFGTKDIFRDPSDFIAKRGAGVTHLRSQWLVNPGDITMFHFLAVPVRPFDIAFVQPKLLSLGPEHRIVDMEYSSDVVLDGKSRFIRECAKQADIFFEFSGLPPRPGLTKHEQLTVFAEQLAKQSKAPRLTLDSWATAFQLLASQLPAKGTAVILLNEISWMGIGEPDFAGYIKNAWDELFSRRANTVVVLCGSVSSWIEANILNNTGFVKRCSWQFHLRPLALHECEQFWGVLHLESARLKNFASLP